MLNPPHSKIQFERDCEAIIRGAGVPGANWLLFGILAFLAAMIAWASIAEIDEVTRGTGSVIPSRSMQLIQSLEGGILAEVAVREGESVREGQTLVRIDDTQFGSQYQESLGRRDVLEARIARLSAEAKKEIAAPNFLERLLKERPDLVRRERELYESRRESIEETLAVLWRNLAFAEQEWELTAPLATSGVISRIEKIRLDREINQIKGEIETTEIEFRREALERRDETNGELEQLLQIIKGSEDRVERAVIKSPVDGTVNKIHLKTIGSVIPSGVDIMEIVPLDDTLLVEARVRPADIAFLSPGQKAITKLTAYDFAIYGGLAGIIEHISADTIEDAQGERFYQIKVRTTEASLEHQGEALPIIPGMVAEVDVLSGRRTVLQYLLKPFNRARSRALTER